MLRLLYPKMKSGWTQRGYGDLKRKTFVSGGIGNMANPASDQTFCSKIYPYSKNEAVIKIIKPVYDNGRFIRRILYWTFFGYI
jgi:hypothetical protein